MTYHTMTDNQKADYLNSLSFSWAQGIDTPADEITNLYAKKLLTGWLHQSSTPDPEEIKMAKQISKPFYFSKGDFLDHIRDVIELDVIFDDPRNVNALESDFGVSFTDVDQLRDHLDTLEVYELYAFLIFLESHTYGHHEIGIWDFINQDEDAMEL